MSKAFTMKVGMTRMGNISGTGGGTFCSVVGVMTALCKPLSRILKHTIMTNTEIFTPFRLSNAGLRNRSDNLPSGSTTVSTHLQQTHMSSILHCESYTALLITT